MTLLIEGMQGLGDSIYQRPLVRAAAARNVTFLETPWPELYRDLDVRFVRPDTPLRTQRRNVERQPEGRWSEVPRHVRRIRIAYGSTELARGGILRAMEEALPLDGRPFVFDLPDFGPPPLSAPDGRPLAVIRPVTVRGEWRNPARNPDPAYLAEAAAVLRDRGWYTLGVADLADRQEWAETPLPVVDREFHGGELDTPELLALIGRADLVVGGVGWIVPACLALRTPLFVVFGGNGGHNAPEKIFDPRLDLSRVAYALPERFCRCTDNRHRCDKTIGDFVRRFRHGLEQLETKRRGE